MADRSELSCARNRRRCSTNTSLRMVMLKKRCALCRRQRFEIAGDKCKIEMISGGPEETRPVPSAGGGGTAAPPAFRVVQPRERARIMNVSYEYSATCHHRY